MIISRTYNVIRQRDVARNEISCDRRVAFGIRVAFDESGGHIRLAELWES